MPTRQTDEQLLSRAKDLAGQITAEPKQITIFAAVLIADAIQFGLAQVVTELTAKRQSK
jgi:hypothetical protein